MRSHQYILFLLLIVCSDSRAQYVSIAGSSKYLVQYSKHSGYAVLKHGKKVSGIFEYADMEFPDYNLKRYSPDSAHIVERIQLKNIQNAVMSGSDAILSTKDSTYFYSLKNDHKLYRQLTDGPIKIYDDLFNVSERPKPCKK